MENYNLEYKRIWNDDYLKTIVAFANTNGGKLLVGVDDNGNKIGLDNQEKLLEDLPNKILNKIGIIAKVKAIDNIIEIEILPYSFPVSFNGKYYYRTGSTTQELNGIELARFLIDKSGVSWVSFVEERAKFEDIDTNTIDKFKAMAKVRLPDIENETDYKIILDKLGLFQDGNLKRAAILLFGKNPQKFYPSAFLKVGKFITDTEIITTDEIEGNLFQQLERIMDIIRTKYLIYKIKFEGIYRKDYLEYPEIALREAIINALIHRDYIGAHTQIKIYQDKIVLWNEGKLIEGIKIENLKQSHPSKQRNELLAKVFFLAGLIETWGRGTIKITDEFKKMNLKEPEFKTEFAGFSVYMYNEEIGGINEGINKGINEGINEGIKSLIKYIKENPGKRNREISENIGEPPKTVERWIKQLRDNGIIEFKGSKKTGGYFIKEGE